MDNIEKSSFQSYFDGTTIFDALKDLGNYFKPSLVDTTERKSKFIENSFLGYRTDPKTMHFKYDRYVSFYVET